LAKEERSSAIVDELKKNADEKAFFGYLSEFLSSLFILKLLFQLSLLQPATAQAKKIGGKAKGVPR